MLCDDCRERPANVHVTKINNNHKVERHLCDACAQKTGEISFSTDTQFAVQDFLKGMLSHGFAGFPRSEAAARCPNCRMTFEDFSRSGKIGCSVCYDSFSDRLNPMLHRIHGTAGHTGKIPKRCGGGGVWAHRHHKSVVYHSRRFPVCGSQDRDPAGRLPDNAHSGQEKSRAQQPRRAGDNPFHRRRRYPCPRGCQAFRP